MKILLLLISSVAFGGYTIKPEPNCVIKGKIEYIFGSKKEIDRPINCAYNDKQELSFCEGDEVKVSKDKKLMRVLTLVPKDEMVYYYSPNYGYTNQSAKLDTVENAKTYDCSSRLSALNKEIKWVVINEAQFHEKPKDTK